MGDSEDFIRAIGSVSDCGSAAEPTVWIPGIQPMDEKTTREQFDQAFLQGRMVDADRIFQELVWSPEHLRDLWRQSKGGILGTLCQETWLKRQGFDMICYDRLHSQVVQTGSLVLFGERPGGWVIYLLCADILGMEPGLPAGPLREAFAALLRVHETEQTPGGAPPAPFTPIPWEKLMHLAEKHPSALALITASALYKEHRKAEAQKAHVARRREIQADPLGCFERLAANDHVSPNRLEDWLTEVLAELGFGFEAAQPQEQLVVWLARATTARGRSELGYYLATHYGVRTERIAQLVEWVTRGQDKCPPDAKAVECRLAAKLVELNSGQWDWVDDVSAESPQSDESRRQRREQRRQELERRAGQSELPN